MKRTPKPSPVVEMRRSWLVQRLNKPQTFGLAGMTDNPFSFGGGLRNGGLSSDAVSLLRPIFSFEYMGAAEFEFGAVPEALSKMAKSSKALVADELTIPLAQVAKSWSDDNVTEPTGEATIYTLCRKGDLDQVRLRILAWASGSRDPEFSTKERVGISDVLRPGRYESDTRGWLELNNGFMFFTDREMWESTCSLFGVTVKAVSS